jgi:peptidyl-prolyl cis-trans isomerase D
MLQNIREKFTGWIALAILGLIALTFVFVGGANFAFVGSNYAAKVDGVEIGLGQFEQSYRDVLQQNPEYATLPDNLRQQLRRNILEELIQQRVVDNYLEEAGYRISDEQVTGLIQQIPDFQSDGRFDIGLYRELLAQNGYDPSSFERAQRVTIRRQQLERAVRGSAVLSPAAYRRFLNLAGEQRVVRMATLDSATVGEDIEVTEEMVTAYYDDNPSLFQLEESADVRYVEILHSDVAQNVDVTEDEILEYYEANSDLYQQDEQRQARHILVVFNDDEAAAEEKATALAARISAGEPFEDIARTNSDDTLTAGQGGDLGTLTRSQLPDELGDAIFDMSEGDVQGPIRSDFGFHIVRLDRIVEQGAMPLEQVRAEITSDLQDQEAEGLFRELERKLSDALFDAESIEQLASAVGVDVKSADGFTRSGGAPLGTDTSIIDAVFDEVVLSGSQLSEIVEADAGRSLVVAVVEHNLATRQPLDDVRDAVENAVRMQQAEEIMAARADELIAALEAGTDFGEAAEAVGATAGEPVLMSRGDQEVDQFVSVAVFTARKPTEDEPIMGTTRNAQGGYTVYSVEAVLPGRPEALPLDQRDAGKAQLTDQTGVGEFIAFVQALRENAEIIVNEDAVAATDLL